MKNSLWAKRIRGAGKAVGRQVAMMLVGEGENLVEFGGDEQDAPALVAQLAQLAVDVFDRTDVHAPRGLRRDQQLGRRFELPREDDLLHVAARQGGERVGRVGGLDEEAFAELLGKAGDLRVGKDAAL